MFVQKNAICQMPPARAGAKLTMVGGGWCIAVQRLRLCYMFCQISGLHMGVRQHHILVRKARCISLWNVRWVIWRA